MLFEVLSAAVLAFLAPCDQADVLAHRQFIPVAWIVDVEHQAYREGKRICCRVIAVVSKR